MSRIVVVDDHPLFCKGLTALLRAEGHDVVAEASDGVEAVTVVTAELPDVVLMDLSMPFRDGFDASAHITAAHPNIKVVVITLFDDEPSVVQALQAGASGYVSKQADPDQIIGAVEAVVHGAMWIGAGVARPALSPATTETLPGHLTAREATIADLLSRGLTNPMMPSGSPCRPRPSPTTSRQSSSSSAWPTATRRHKLCARPGATGQADPPSPVSDGWLPPQGRGRPTMPLSGPPDHAAVGTARPCRDARIYDLRLTGTCNST